MTALVLGGSGHVGNAIVRALRARGDAVTVARRGRTAARNLDGLAVAHAIGDADDAGVLARWIAGHAVVFDAAAPYPWTLGERGAIDRARRRAGAIVEAAARGGARVVHVGSFATALGVGDDGLPREPGRRLDAQLHPYFAAKRAGEAVFVAAARGGGPVAIAHPTTCLGPWDSRPPTHAVIPSVLEGRLRAVPARTINVVDVRDVARGALALASSAPTGGPVRLAGHNVSVAELCALVGELGRVRVDVRAVPAVAARAAAWAVEVAAPGVVSPPLLLPTLLTLLQAPLQIGPAQRALGAAPRPLSATLRDAIAWYRGGCDIAADA